MTNAQGSFHSRLPLGAGGWSRRPMAKGSRLHNLFHLCGSQCPQEMLVTKSCCLVIRSLKLPYLWLQASMSGFWEIHVTSAEQLFSASQPQSSPPSVCKHWACTPGLGQQPSDKGTANHPTSPNLCLLCVSWGSSRPGRGGGDTPLFPVQHRHQALGL